MPRGPGAEVSWNLSSGKWDEDEEPSLCRRLEWYSTSTGAWPFRRTKLTPSTARPCPPGPRGRQGSTAEPPAHDSTRVMSTEPGASPVGEGGVRKVTSNSNKGSDAI